MYNNIVGFYKKGGGAFMTCTKYILSFSLSVSLEYAQIDQISVRFRTFDVPHALNHKSYFYSTLLIYFPRPCIFTDSRRKKKLERVKDDAHVSLRRIVKDISLNNVYFWAFVLP